MNRLLDKDPLDALFEKPVQLQMGKDKVELELSKLKSFSQHPFHPYEGTRMARMVESVRENGILEPIIVRRAPDRMFEILAGHNRVQAAIQVGLLTVPAMIKENVSDDEALIIVTESNTNQRATSDMLPSELAKALKMQLDAYKRLKRQSKYVENVENWLDPVPENGFGENVGIQHLEKSRDVVARGNGIGVFKARSYLRLNFLIPLLLNRVDDNEIALYVAGVLSFLKEEEQKLVEQQLVIGKKVDIRKADKLREVSENGQLDAETIRLILSGTLEKQKKVKPQSMKVIQKFISQHFEAGQTHQEIVTYLEATITLYAEVMKQQVAIGLKISQEQQ